MLEPFDSSSNFHPSTLSIHHPVSTYISLLTHSLQLSSTSLRTFPKNLQKRPLKKVRELFDSPLINLLFKWFSKTCSKWNNFKEFEADMTKYQTISGGSVEVLQFSLQEVRFLKLVTFRLNFICICIEKEKCRYHVQKVSHAFSFDYHGIYVENCNSDQLGFNFGIKQICANL